MEKNKREKKIVFWNQGHLKSSWVLLHSIIKIHSKYYNEHDTFRTRDKYINLSSSMLFTWMQMVVVHHVHEKMILQRAADASPEGWKAAVWQEFWESDELLTLSQHSSVSWGQCSCRHAHFCPEAPLKTCLIHRDVYQYQGPETFLIIP